MNDIATLQSLQNLPCERGEVAAVSGSGSFLPRVQFYSGKSGAVSQGKIPANQFGLVTSGDDNIQILGPETDCIILASRPKAMDLSTDPITVLYDVKKEGGKIVGPYADIMAKAESEDEATRQTAMYGPEFLIYLPEKQVFATLFFGTKSARIQAGNVRALMHKAATLNSVKIDTNKPGKKGYIWTTPSAKPCARQFELPPIEKIESEITLFLTAPESTGAAAAARPAEEAEAER